MPYLSNYVYTLPLDRLLWKKKYLEVLLIKTIRLDLALKAEMGQEMTIVPQDE